VVCYLLPLRYSWDNLNDLLGLASFFAALGQIPRETGGGSWTRFGLLVAVSVLAEQIEAVLMGALAGYMFLRSLKSEGKQIRAWFITGVCCFGVVLAYSHQIVPSGPSPFPPHSPIATISPIMSGAVAGTTPYANYVSAAFAATLTILLGIMVIILPAYFGFFRNPVVDGLTLLLSAATVSVFLPGLTISVWPTWLFLLAFPLLLYAYRGLKKMRIAFRLPIIGFILLTTVGFLSLPPQYALPYLTSEQTRWYIPTSAMQNTIPLDRVKGVEDCVAWLDAHVKANDAVVVSQSFYGYVQVEGNPMTIYVYSSANAFNWTALRADMIYSIAWTDNMSWYTGGPIPSRSQIVFSSHSVGVFALELNQSGTR